MDWPLYVKCYPYPKAYIYFFFSWKFLKYNLDIWVSSSSQKDTQIPSLYKRMKSRLASVPGHGKLGPLRHMSLSTKWGRSKVGEKLPLPQFPWSTWLHSVHSPTSNCMSLPFDGLLWAGKFNRAPYLSIYGWMQPLQFHSLEHYLAPPY